MKFLTVTLAVVLLAALASAQFYGPGSFRGFEQQRGFYGLNALIGDYGVGGGARDARQNTGPVVFPPSPENVPNESSGVVVGASGFGFVPPNSQRSFNYGY